MDSEGECPRTPIVWVDFPPLVRRYAEGRLAVNKRKLLASAQRNVQRGALDKALKDYETLLEADPRDANVKLKLGDLQLRRGQPEDAITAYLNVADQFMRDGFDAKAVAIYKQVTKIDAKRYDIYLPLAELYQRLGLISEAMAALQSAADGYQREGKRRDALDLLRKMSGLDPANIPSRLKVADLLAHEELAEEALAEYEEVLSELREQGDWETQISVYERILEVDPNRVTSLGEFARLYLEHGELEKAEALGRRLVAADPELAESNELLADILIARGNDGAANGFYRAAAEAYRERGDEAKSRDLMQRHVADESLDFGAVASGAGDGGAAAGGEFEPDFAFEADTGGIGELSAGDDVMDLGFDADSSSQADPEPIELDVPVEPQSEPPAAPVEAPTPAAVPEPVAARDDVVTAGVDIDQLIAEASVYGRYGKHERAVQTLEAVLAQDPDHAGALEELGNANHALGDEAGAVVAWSRACRLLADAGDADRGAAIRTRLAELDPQAAAELGGSPEPKPAARPRPAPQPALPRKGPVEPTAPEPDAIEIELDLSSDLNEPDVAPEVQVPTADATPATAGGELEDMEFEVDPSLLEGDPPTIDADADDDTHASQAPVDAGVPQAVAPTDPEPSASTSQQIQEELEEANFYFEQGLYDEALPLYEQILQRAPNHPGALLRIGEIEAAQHEGGDAPPAEQGPEDVAVPLDRDEPADAGADTSDEALTEPSAVPAEEPPFTPERPDVPELTVPDLSGASPDDSFDLAAELSDALGDSAAGTDGEEAGFDTIFREFKRGVSETLDEGDVETHFDLGIAYREMGLFEDAIGEFRIALESDARRIDGLHMMALCALELGRTQDAVGHLEQALATPAVPDDREAVLRFDLGRAYEAGGDSQRALDSLRRVAELHPGFQDVEERIAALETGLVPASDDEAETAEAYETFDDLIEMDANLEESEAGSASESAESAIFAADEAAWSDGPAASVELAETEPFGSDVVTPSEGAAPTATSGAQAPHFAADAGETAPASVECEVEDPDGVAADASEEPAAESDASESERSDGAETVEHSPASAPDEPQPDASGESTEPEPSGAKRRRRRKVSFV